MKNVKKTLVAVACAGLACITAADPVPSITVTFDSWIFQGSGYDNVTLTFPNANSAGSSSVGAAAGRFQGTGSNVVGVPASIFVDNLNDLYMYCYDVYQDISHGQTVTYTIDFNGETERTRDFLGAVNSVMNGGKTAGMAGYDRFAWLHPVTGYQGAAIQLGIWESLYETSANPLNLAGGAFKATGIEGSTQSYLNQFFDAVSTSDALPDADVMVLRNGSYQDMITGDPVPEPGTLALLGAALAGWGLVRRKTAPKV